MRANKAAGPSRGPGAFPLLAEQTPQLVHRLAAPIVAPLTAPLAGRLFNTVITHVPLPRVHLAVDGAQLAEVYPVVPLAAEQPWGSRSAPTSPSRTWDCGPTTPPFPTWTGSPGTSTPRSTIWAPSRLPGSTTDKPGVGTHRSRPVPAATRNQRSGCCCVSAVSPSCQLGIHTRAAHDRTART